MCPISHSAPFPAEYDQPGMPYTLLVEAVGCPSGSASLSCLQNLSFDVYFSLYIQNILSDFLLLDSPECV